MNPHHPQEELHQELNQIYELARSVSIRANNIAESTQNPSQATLDRLAKEAGEVRQRLDRIVRL